MYHIYSHRGRSSEAADPCVHDQNSPYIYIHSCTRIPNVVNPWKPKDADFLNWYGYGFVLFGKRKQNPGSLGQRIKGSGLYHIE